MRRAVAGYVKLRDKRPGSREAERARGIRADPLNLIWVIPAQGEPEKQSLARPYEEEGVR